jgi:hypothetical protein
VCARVPAWSLRYDEPERPPSGHHPLPAPWAGLPGIPPRGGDGRLTSRDAHAATVHQLAIVLADAAAEPLGRPHDDALLLRARDADALKTQRAQPRLAPCEPDAPHLLVDRTDCSRELRARGLQGPSTAAQLHRADRSAEPSGKTASAARSQRQPAPTTPRRGRRQWRRQSNPAQERYPQVCQRSLGRSRRRYASCLSYEPRTRAPPSASWT